MGWACGGVGGERLAKEEDAQRVEGNRGGGRPGLRWEECMKIHLTGGMGNKSN